MTTRPQRYLARLNGELEPQPEAAKNIAGLENLVMVNFERDRKGIPDIRRSRKY